MGYNLNDLKKSSFLKKEDVAKPMLVTIESFDEVNVAMEGAEPDMKLAVHFKELNKPLVLNSTNGQVIQAIVGSSDTDDAIGHKIVLYNDPNVFFQGRMTGGIRVRAPKQLNQPAPKPIDTSEAAKLERAKKIAAVMKPTPVEDNPEMDDIDEAVNF